MKAASQGESAIYRVIVLNRTATAILVVPEGSSFALPAVRIPHWRRVAETLTAAVRCDWGAEVICLFTLPCGPGVTDAHKVIYQVAEYWRDCSMPRVPTQWVPLSALSSNDSLDRSDHAAIRQSIEQSCAAERGLQLGPFTCLGWFKDLRDWLETVIAKRGLHLDHLFQQVSASPSFSLIRCETDGPAIWFKAVGEPNLREFPITVLLAQRFPRYVPKILAARSDWSAWVSEEIAGTNLTGTKATGLWQSAAVALADLQIASVNEAIPFLSAGAHDLRISTLSELVHPFLETMTQLMGQQKKSPPAILKKADLTLLEERLHGALARLTELAIPDSLGHLDLNPGNVIVSPDQCRFLDWAEAYVGPPFLTFEYLLEHYRRTVGPNAALEASLASSYYGKWRQFLSSDVLDEAQAVGSLLAVFAYAVGCETSTETENKEGTENAGYLRSLTRRMWREASRLNERVASSC